MNINEMFGGHIRECEPTRAEIDWPEHPMDGFLGWVIGYGITITVFYGYPVGDTDTIFLPDGEDSPICLHQNRINEVK